MGRLFAFVFGILVVASTAHAQAFKPRGGKGAKTTTTATDKTDKTDKSSDAKPAKPAAKPTKAAKTQKAAKAADSESDDSDSDAEKKPVSKKAIAHRGTAKATKKSRAAKDDLTPEPGGKGDPDYVVITDDDDDE